MTHNVCVRLFILAAFSGCGDSEWGDSQSYRCPACDRDYKCGSDTTRLQKVDGVCYGSTDSTFVLECNGTVTQNGTKTGTWSADSAGGVTQMCEDGRGCWSCTPK